MKNEVVSSSACALFLLIAVGAGLRLYRLSEQSVWIDEYNVLSAIDSPSLLQAVQASREWNPDTAPLTFVCFYAWKILSGAQSPMAMRFLAVGLSLLLLPGVFLIARKLYGAKAGLIALAFIAFSPIQIFIAQGIRPEILATVFCFGALFCTVQMILDHKPGWIYLSLICNLLAMWSHPITIFLLPAQGLVFLPLLRQNKGPVLLWGFACLASIALLWRWLSVAKGLIPSASEDFFMTLPPWRAILSDYFADDALVSADPFLYQGPTWAWIPTAWHQAFFEAHRFFDAALIVLIALLCCGVLLGLLRSKRGQERCPRQSQAEFFLILVIFLPLSLLLILSCLWRPILNPRYTYYAGFAAYVLVSGMLCRITKPLLRRSLMAAFVLIFLYQLSLALPGASRSNWMGVQRKIAHEAQENDLVLSKGVFNTWEIYRRQHPIQPFPLRPALSYQEAYHLSQEHLGKYPKEETSVWLVVEPFIFTLPPKESFEACLKEAGLRFRFHYFPGMNGLLLYRIWRDTAPPPKKSSCLISPAFDLESALDNFQITQEKERTDAAQAIAYALDSRLPPGRFYYSLLSLNLSYQGRPDLALRVADSAIEKAPNYPLASFSKAIALAEQGRVAEAQEAFQASCEIDPFDYFSRYQVFFHAYYGDQDSQAARAAFLRMDREGLFLPYLWRKAFGQFEESAVARTSSR